MRCLPVSGEDRKSWVLTPPEGVQNTYSDYVSYHVVKGPPEFQGRFFPVANYATPEAAAERFSRSPNFPSTACYSAISPHYDRFELYCHPRQRTLGDFGLVSSFFEILSAQGIIPPGLSIEDQKPGVLLHIPQGAGNPHLVYAALTAFRWADCHGRLVWGLVRLYERGLSPFQTLPYLIAKYVNNCNHSFINSYAKGNIYGMASSDVSPGVGLAARMYFHGMEERAKADFEDPRKHSNTAIDELSRRLIPHSKTIVKARNGWSTDQETHTPLFRFEKPEDALSPVLAELYTDLNLTKDRVEKFLNETFTKEIDTCDESAS